MTELGVAPIQLRAGIIGAGLMGRWHAQAIERSGGRVVAIVDPDPVAARSLAKRHPHATALVEYREALEQRAFDVLHVCSPLPTHAGIAEAAVRARIPQLIEKPMTMTAMESQDLLELANEHAVLVCPVHQFLFQDGVRSALEHLHQIGTVVHMQATICSAGGGVTDASRLDGIVADMLSHPLSLMQRFLPDALPIQGWVTTHPAAGELRASAQASGTTLAIFISMHARPTVCAFDVAGTEGTIHVDLYHGYAVVEPRTPGQIGKIARPFTRALKTLGAATVNLGRRTMHWEPAYPGLRNLIAAFYQAVGDGGESPISPQEALAVARLRDVMIASAALATVPAGR